MARASMVLPNGTKVDLDGNADEVALLLDLLGQTSAKPSSRGSPAKQKGNAIGDRLSRGAREATGVRALIEGLANEDFFKTKRALADVQRRLEELGHIYPITTISPCLTRMTKGRFLRRLKENNVWVYVN